MTLVEGVSIEGPDAIEALVRRQLSHGTVWSDRADVTDVDGLCRAIGSAGALRGAFAEAVLHLLHDDDVRVRTGAVAALPEVRDLIGADRLADLLTAQPKRFERVKPRTHALGPHKDLAGAVYAAVAAQVLDDGAASPATVAVLRQGAPQGRWVLPALARVDADWLVERAARLVPRVAIGGVLTHLPTAAHRRGLVEALAPWPAQDAETQLGWTYWKNLPPDEVAALQAVLRRAGT